MKILLVEDDNTTAEYINQGLVAQGFVTDWLTDGQEGLMLALQHDFDVIILDRMLPSLDGISILRSLRAARKSTPIIFLTAVSGVHDRIEGLDAGADDYLVKPFLIEELISRIHAICRRPNSISNTVLSVGALNFDLATRIVNRGDVKIDLSPKEQSLLEILMKNEGRIVSKSMLLERVWQFNFMPHTTVVETHISRLRSKIDKPFDQKLIHTVRNMGYSLYAV